MLLSDTEIIARIADLRVEAENPNFPFAPDRQIQPCSIDLRLSEIFWTPHRFRRIDLSDNTPLGPKVTSAFRRRRMSFPKGYLLRPGRFVLARTYEKFEIPPDLSGRLVGRSSAGRLGLSVAFGANFINPGWRGHMPVLLVNHSPFPIRIHPYLSVVQLCLFRLTSQPRKLYGDDGTGSKYIDDEGGPSRYWLDHTIIALRQNLNIKNSSQKAEAFLEAYARELDDPTRERFVGFLKRYGYVESGPDFANAFIQDERGRIATTWLLSLLCSAIISVAIRFLPTLMGLGTLGWAGAIPVGIIVCIILVYVYTRQFHTSMNAPELRRLIGTVQGRRT